MGGCPSIIRTDCGSENNLMAAIQCHLTGSLRGHIYGTSPGNQRIEAWWSFLRRNRAQYWIELFEGLVSARSFEPGNDRLTDCLRFCFMDVIRRDLQFVADNWNTHRIRPSQGARCPAGIPNELFVFPVPPAQNCLIVARHALPQEVTSRVVQPKVCAVNSLDQYFTYLCEYHHWSTPRNLDDALQMYHRLKVYV